MAATASALGTLCRNEELVTDTVVVNELVLLDGVTVG